MTKDKDKKVPVLRFKGFTDDWEQRKLEEVVKIIGGGTPSTKISKYWNGNINWYSPTEISNKIFVNSSRKKITELGLKKSSAKLLPGGRTILFTSRAVIGDMAIMTTNGSTNQGFQSWVVNSKLANIYFLFSLGKEIKKQALRKASGSTFLEISNSEVKKLILSVPNLEEQTNIGKLLRLLDNLITLQQRKLKLIKQIETALSSQIFSKINQKSNLRFQNFSDEWERCELQNIARVISGGTPSTKNNKFWNGNINWYSPTEIGTNKYVISSRKKISELGLKNSSAKMLPGKETILFTSRAKIGEIAILVEDGCTSQGFQSWIIDSKRVNIEFLYYLGKNLKKQAIRKASGSTFLEISNHDVKKLKLKVPSLKEQVLIGKLFASLDTLLINENKAKRKIKSLKTFLMNNLFI